MATAVDPASLLQGGGPQNLVEQDGNAPSASAPQSGYGPNNEKLFDAKPELVNEIKRLVDAYRTEGTSGRREEIRRIKQARLFWQSKHFDYFWSEKNLDFLPISQQSNDKDEQAGARFQFVTNIYQAFGLTFIAVMSQDVPSIRWYPQSAQNPRDIATAKAASDVEELITENNEIQQILTDIGLYFWTDGKIGAYVRYVADGQRFGWTDQPEYSTGQVPMDGAMMPSLQQSTRKVAKGQEVITIVDGLQLNTPVWARDQKEFPYLQWEMEVHSAKLKASYPLAAKKIGTSGGAGSADEQNARNARLQLAAGASASDNTRNQSALNNLISYSRTWIRPWAFYALENEAVRDELVQMFPDGCYVAFAGDVYCESRNESMDAYWRVRHAMPGDGQNRPAVGTSTVDVQERLNTLSNLQMEITEHGIPSTYADPKVLNFDALSGQTAEPGAIYPATAKSGARLSDGFFQPPAAEMPADAIRHMTELFSSVPQFLTGLFPAVFGGDMGSNDTAQGIAMSREQALGRIGLIWRSVKELYADVMQLGVECFQENRTEDAEIPQMGDGGEYEAKMIHIADLQGKAQCRPEADEQYPRMRSQKAAALQALMAVEDPTVQAVLSNPANLGFIKSTLGLPDLVIPDDDSRQKQMRETEQLLQGAPVQIDPMLDNHQVEFEECRRWANSEDGQQARAQNPNGFAAVRDHAAQHQAQIMMQSMPPPGAPPHALPPAGGPPHPGLPPGPPAPAISGPPLPGGANGNS